jgi:hypothetical protein
MQAADIEAQAAVVEAITDRLAGPLTVWVLETQTRHGEDFEVYATKQGAVDGAVGFWDHQRTRWGADDGRVDDAIAGLRRGDTNVGHDDDWTTITENEVKR